jgi:hypothetical protein
MLFISNLPHSQEKVHRSKLKRDFKYCNILKFTLNFAAKTLTLECLSCFNKNHLVRGLATVKAAEKILECVPMIWLVTSTSTHDWVVAKKHVVDSLCRQLRFSDSHFTKPVISLILYHIFVRTDKLKTKNCNYCILCYEIAHVFITAYSSTRWHSRTCILKYAIYF